MTKGIVFKIKKYALHDGPGIRTTVFFKGCPLSCWWCHNPEGQSMVPQRLNGGGRNEIVGKEMTVDQVLTEIEKDRIFYDESGGGATFSGGEPMMQPQFLEALLTACRSREIHTAIDTSGHAPPEIFARLTGLTDLVLFDLKLMDPEAHRLHTGVDNQLIIENFKTLCRSGTTVSVRFPLVPLMTDGEDNIRAIAEFIRHCGGPRHIDLLPFHRIGMQKYTRLDLANKMAGVSPPSQEDIQRVQAGFGIFGLSTQIGG